MSHTSLVTHDSSQVDGFLGVILLHKPKISLLMTHFHDQYIPWGRTLPYRDGEQRAFAEGSQESRVGGPRTNIM